MQVTAERKQWAKFGLARESNKGVTAQSVDQVMFERTNMPKKEEKKDAASAAKQHMVRFNMHAPPEPQSKLDSRIRHQGTISGLMVHSAQSE